MNPSILDARLYLVAQSHLTAGRLADMVPELVDAGVDVIQLREKEMEAGDLIRAGEPVRTACKDAGVPFILNDRPDVALALEADGVHVGQNDLPVRTTRDVMGDKIVGLSTHRESEIDGALEDAIDYFAVGPVYETPTKSGRPATGSELIRYAAATGTDIPWFAIGGIDLERMEEVVEAGARRVVVVRAIGESKDPPAAAASLRKALEQGGAI